MRIRIITVGMLSLLSMAILAAPQSQTGGDAVFRDCRVKEMIDNDIPAAIGLCERVVREFGSNRALAVDALLELGKMLEKTDEARARDYYQQVAAKYADLPEKAADAQRRLTAMGPSSTSSGIYSVDIDPATANVLGTAPARLTTNPDRLSDGFPVFSPDGKSIAFIREMKLKIPPIVFAPEGVGGSSRTKYLSLVVRSSTGEETSHARGILDLTWGRPVWFADGNAILFGGPTATGGSQPPAFFRADLRTKESDVFWGIGFVTGSGGWRHVSGPADPRQPASCHQRYQ